ncbi:hypothetical protein EW146_g4754 [Bondarzewia mesenterica]|uniref:Nitrogen permease regulator 3 n=1 Tax=Bondarzewia mesenterica TaxID=1095465 RepID=A0A4S4LUL7_9AGAM|nr:hypothetical protein EW146_g4754 [Bondarzewia mesenterica]
MAETLMAIVLVTSSARGSSLVCRWPPSPQTYPRLARARPVPSTDFGHFDNPWRAANLADISSEPGSDHLPVNINQGDWDYIWRRPHITRDRSVSFSHSASHSASGRNSPIKDSAFEFDDAPDDTRLKDDYDDFLGYSSEFLASMLCPQRALCHQKFELVVDDLCFIGHPVCAELDNLWRFKPEKSKVDTRGRGSKKRRSGEDLASSVELDRNSPPMPAPQKSAWLQTFHLAFVHDLPDPSSSASGNIEKYFDIIYEQVVFFITAVLFQEQVLSNFVESECDTLGILKDEFAGKGESYENFMKQALVISSIAPAMKILYEAIKNRSLAHLTIHNLPLELQLPPYLDSLLHSEDDLDAVEQGYQGDVSNRDGNSWSRELSFAWRLPSLEPWKSLLLLDDPGDKEWMGVDANLRAANVREEDRMLAEQLIVFLKMADVTLSCVQAYIALTSHWPLVHATLPFSLADMATLLDWDLESQVFPIVRWLVHHRRAKVVDVVDRGLKTVFALPVKIESPIKDLSKEFRQAFPDPAIPSLPHLLSTISSLSSNHFYAAVVKSKELVPTYHPVVQWMLKKDLLVTLHVWIRVVATAEIKNKVGRARKSNRRTGKEESKMGRKAMTAHEEEQLESEKDLEMLFDSPRWLPLSPKSAFEGKRRASGSRRSPLSDFGGPPILEEDIEADEYNEKDAGETEEETSGEVGTDFFEDDDDDERVPSIISDPGRATYKENKWLEAMSEGRDKTIAQRFEQINRYFDGKCSDDEILFRAEISRKQLREVLHHYDEYLEIFLHPS